MPQVKLTANGFTVYAPTLEDAWDQITGLVQDRNAEERQQESEDWDWADFGEPITK